MKPQHRARDLGLPLPGRPGPYNAITDVPGVEVGFTTLKSLAASPADRQIYTGVTAILPRGHARKPMGSQCVLAKLCPKIGVTQSV